MSGLEMTGRLAESLGERFAGAATGRLAGQGSLGVGNGGLEPGTSLRIDRSTFGKLRAKLRQKLLQTCPIFRHKNFFLTWSLARIRAGLAPPGALAGLNRRQYNPQLTKLLESSRLGTRSVQAIAGRSVVPDLK